MLNNAELMLQIVSRQWLGISVLAMITTRRQNHAHGILV
jgi:hypothetical protein